MHTICETISTKACETWPKEYLGQTMFEAIELTAPIAENSDAKAGPWCCSGPKSASWAAAALAYNLKDAKVAE
eukprot:228777-Alexandrium_andersonii.AAC.1